MYIGSNSSFPTNTLLVYHRLLPLKTSATIGNGVGWGDPSRIQAACKYIWLMLNQPVKSNSPVSPKALLCSEELNSLPGVESLKTRFQLKLETDPREKLNK